MLSKVAQKFFKLFGSDGLFGGLEFQICFVIFHHCNGVLDTVLQMKHALI